jgi:chorismate dehydratase
MHHALIRFLNARPLWWGLVHGPQDPARSFEFTSPARCADLLSAGGADLGLIPAIELARISDVVAIPSICIASKREVRSVLLFSKKPFEEIRSVALDPASRTSVSLARILLGERLGREIYSRIKFDAVEPAHLTDLTGHDAAVVIGDPALQVSKNPKFSALFRYDLASEWNALFGEPFVFALWGGRREALERHDASEIVRTLQESRAYGLAHLATIASEAAEEIGIDAAELLDYFTNALHYFVGEEERSALARFYRLAGEYGLIEREREVPWLKVPTESPKF